MSSRKGKQGKYAILLKDEDVNRWYDNVARGSLATADVYLRRLGSFSQRFSRTPEALALLNQGDLYNLMLDYVSAMEKNGYAGSYIESTLKAVKSWLAHNGIVVNRKIKIRGARDTPSLKNERVPTQDELRRILLSGTKKARVACIFVAHSGLRIKTLGNYQGKDGLTIKDLPEIAVTNDSVNFDQTPTIVTVRRELSKAGHQYFTFLSEEGCQYLKNYLEERQRGGETLTAESPIITPKLPMKPFIRAINIGDAIRGAIRGAGLPWRPYVLRSYFDTQLMLSESKGLVLRDYRAFWMGHKGDIENRYTTNKAKLPETVIDDMREAYRRSQAYLQTTKPEQNSEEELRQTFRKQLLLVAGFSERELEQTDVSSMSDEELQVIVRKRLLGQKADDCTQMIVSGDDVDRYLMEGWEFVAALPNGKIILRLSDK
jgi:hypothetical protein